jgi:hypothetical protein
MKITPKSTINTGCDHKLPPCRIKVDIKALDPIGHAELHTEYEICPYCATMLSTGQMNKKLKKIIQEIIQF